MSELTTRNEIIDVANRLFYERGYESTSFADIANELGISKGNFYYHFKTKDEILEAVIISRVLSTNYLLETWEKTGAGPVERIRAFINILIMNRASIMNYGCPVGTLCTELAKLNHPYQDKANELFTLFRVWLRKQFEQIGFRENADVFAMHILARSQGVAVLANAFQDERFIRDEARQAEEWLDFVVNTMAG